MVASGRDFLRAIKESTSIEFDEDAAEFLDDLRRAMSGILDGERVRGEKRDAIFLFEGMLRGAQIVTKGLEQRLAIDKKTDA
jgi:hypothetical protein